MRNDAVTADVKNLNILIYNSDLPVFPGAGSHEFLNTTQLARWAKQVGLVSMAHQPHDLEKAALLEDKNIKLFLWRPPHLALSEKNGPTAAAAPPKKRFALLKKIVWQVHGHIVKWADAQAKKISKRPDDLFFTDKLFRHLSTPLSSAFASHDWQVLVVIQSSFAKLIDYIPPCPVSVLVMHDIRALVYERRANMLKPSREQRYLQRQAKRYFNFEKAQCKKFDLIIALSQYDHDWIKKNYQPQRIAIVPVPIDTDYFSPQPRHLITPGRIVFTGHMAHPPNVDAAIYFAKEIFPLIKQQIKGAEFFIVGKNPTDAVLALAQLPGVTVTGTVADTRPYLASAAVVVVPLRFGSGVRNKILEAWAMEKCIVATRLGAEGLEYCADTDLIIAEDLTQMTTAVINVLSSTDYQQKLSQHGRTLAEKNHNPSDIGLRYFQAIKAVAAEKSSQKSALRLAVDVRWMVPGLAGGIENVARSFIKELNQTDHRNLYTLMLNYKYRSDFSFIKNNNFTFLSQHPLDVIRGHLQLLWGKVCSKLRIEHFYLPNILNFHFLRQLNVDMIYSFPGYIRPECFTLPNILMVPDIQHEYLPDFFPGPILAERKRVYGDSIKNAAHICAISAFTRQTLIDKLQIDPQKITTILLAADPSFTTVPQPTEQMVLQKYQLTTESYLFFPAHTWHHKNHLAAIHALKILRDKYHLTPYLICTGGAREAQLSIEKCIMENDLQKQVRFLGYCPHDELPVLYRNAIALLYPSLFEGFGMPVLEAMNSGCPVICSNTTSLPEIAENAALLIGPHDHEAMADAIFKIMQDRDYRKLLQQQGTVQAAKFSWQKHTRETIAVFERVFAQLRGI